MRANIFVSNMFWGQVGRMSELVLGFLFNVAVIRQLTVTEYGAYSTIINLVGVLQYFTFLGLSDSLTRFVPLGIEAQPPYHYSLLRRFLWIRMLAGASLGLAIMSGGVWLAQLFNSPEIERYSWIIPLLSLTFTLVDLFLNFYIAAFRLRETAWARPLVQFLTLGGILVWFGLFSPSLLAVLVVTLISNSLMCAFYLLRLPPAKILSAPKLAETSADTKTIFNYSRDLWLTLLCSLGLSGWVDIILIGIVLTDQTQVAYYALVMMLISRSSAFAMGWIGTVSSISATVLMEKGIEGLTRYYNYFYKLNLLPNLFFLGYFGAAGSALVVSLFTERYAPSLATLLVYSGFWFTMGMLGGGINSIIGSVLGKQNYILRTRFLFSLFNLILELLLLFWVGLIGAAIATIIATVLTHLVEFYFIRSLIKKLPFWFILKISGLTTVAAISGGLVARNDFSGWLVASAVYSMIWFGGLLIVKPLDANDKEVLTNWRPSLAKIVRFF
jgi:O-antigen/teichoic acid export membrane protein